MFSILDLELPRASRYEAQLFFEISVVVLRGRLLDVASMANIALAAYLILVGLNILFGLDIPVKVLGTLALIAGILMLLERFGFGFGVRKK